jgi:hypothetical protein
MDRQRALLLAIRQALIMMLGAIEDYLEIERSIIPRHKRKDLPQEETPITA